jgi:hypothetical protein
MQQHSSLFMGAALQAAMQLSLPCCGLSLWHKELVIEGVVGCHNPIWVWVVQVYFPQWCRFWHVGKVKAAAQLTSRAARANGVPVFAASMAPVLAKAIVERLAAVLGAAAAL